MSQACASYGAWVSPVSVELMTGAAVGLSSLAVDGPTLYWLEARPAESGRTVLCRRRANGQIEELTLAPSNVGSRVHEYGGGAYAVADGVAVYSERKDGSVWLIEADASPRQIATPEGCRYADFELDLRRRRVLAIREDHRERPPTDPKAAIVALPLDSDGSEEVLVEGPDFLSSPRLSPSGDWIAWIAWDHPDMPWDRTRLFIAGLMPDGMLGPSNLVAGQAPESIVQPEWSAGDILHFCSDRTGWWNLYALRGGAATPVAPVEAEIGGPHWVFRQRYYAFLPDGRIVVAIVRDGIRSAGMIAEGAIAPLDIGQVLDTPQPLGDGLAYIATPPTAPPAVTLTPGSVGGAPQIVRAAAPSVLAPETISLGEAIDFPARGGSGHAFWFPPKNQEFKGPPGELPPLVVLSHGGPTSMTTNSFNLNIQWWTSRGIGVVDVNYGGSTGFGRDYRRRLNGQWGVVDVEDCAAAANYLVERGLVDGARLAIRGGSAGGFTTLKALTSSTLFKAGASLYGVADLMLLARDTHKFESRYLDALIGPLPERQDLYLERSPIHHLDRLACPVIFFQGEDDKTVPPNQARTMVEAMSARRLPVAFYVFEGEGHGFRKAETLRRVLELELDFYGRIFGFAAPGLSEHVTIANMDER
ncbi:S9 family peptidase [Methylocapsa aurea]|uniref:S9 family peptidase n=1 Tax=Methylocapsa aurea TaxID=663610 RepID=UPI00055FA5B5|nr:prolyl oligopeptidase family serine peptidase [Methylocapsa aurea]